MTDPPEHARFLGHYRLLRPLGAGGMGEVYLAHDVTLERQVAIKLLPELQPASDTARRRLLREAQAAAGLDHPNICAVHEVATDGGRSFIVMQFVEGETLAERMHRGPLPIEETLDLVAQVADALAFAHAAGVVHRDVKPQNIMVGPGGRVKVLDFGLAKVFTPNASDLTPTETALTARGVPVGTAAYMAPEQVRCEPVDGRADLFSLGVVLYECLTGRRPFDGRSTFDVLDAIVHRHPSPPSAVNPRVPPALNALCLRLLAKSPHERVQSAGELRAALETLRHGSGPGGRGLDVPDAPRAWPRWTLPVAAAVATLVLLVAWAFLWRPVPLPPPNAAAAWWYGTGVKGLQSGTYQQAVGALEEAVALDDAFVMAWARLAEAQSQLDDLRSAQASLTRVWQLVPDRSRLPRAERLQLEAIAAMVSRRGGEAVAAYEALAALAPRDAHVQVDLGRAWEIVPDFERAASAYAAAIALDSQVAAGHFRRAVLLGQRGEHEGALAAFDEAERIFRAASEFEGQAEVYLERAHLFLRREQLAEAHAQLDRAMQIASAARLEHQHVRAELLTARVLLKQVRFQEAERHVREALQRTTGLDVLHAQALVDLGNLFAGQSRYTESERHYRDAIERAGRVGAPQTEARARLSLASALLLLGRVVESRPLAESARAYYDANGFRREALQARQVLGRAADVTGDLDTADRIWRELLATGEQEADGTLVTEALDGLANSRARRGELPEALAYTERVLAEYERQGNPLYATYARLRRTDLLARLGRLAEARKEIGGLRAALAGTPDLASLVPYVDGIEARLWLSEGQPARAATRACGSIVAVADDPGWQVEMKGLCAVARSRAGDHAGAEAAATSALGLARSLEDQVVRAQALAAAADVAARAGRVDLALERSAETARVLEPLRAHEWLWRLHAATAEAAARAGRRAEADRLADDARTAWDALRREWPPDAITSYLATDAARLAPANGAVPTAGR